MFYPLPNYAYTYIKISGQWTYLYRRAVDQRLEMAGPLTNGDEHRARLQQVAVVIGARLVNVKCMPQVGRRWPSPMSPPERVAGPRGTASTRFSIQT